MRRRNTLLVAAFAVLALTACGSAPEQASEAAGSGAKVATLTSAGPTPSASAAAERPRERLDMTPEESEALLGPYNKCLKDRGVDSVEAKRAADAQQPATQPLTGEAAEELDEVYRYCETQFYPLPAWEKDPANPESRDFSVAVVKCLKARGIEFVEVSEDGIGIALGGDDNDPRSISRGLDLMPECEREVAAKN